MAAPNTATSTTRSAVETVEAFLDALQRIDIEAARALMAPQTTYQNVPFPTARGAVATERVLKGFLLPFSGFHVETLHIAAQGGADGSGVVLTERVDTLSRGPVHVRFWVCGTFEVEDGLITVWRDRFDLVDVTVAVLRGLLMAPFRR